MFRLTHRHSGVVFLVGALSAIVFALASANLFTTGLASAGFIAEFKWLAIRHGALWQVLQLSLSRFLALAAWLSFKACEHILVDRYLSWSSAGTERPRTRGRKAG